MKTIQFMKKRFAKCFPFVLLLIVTVLMFTGCGVKKEDVAGHYSAFAMSLGKDLVDIRDEYFGVPMPEIYLYEDGTGTFEPTEEQFVWTLDGNTITIDAGYEMKLTYNDGVVTIPGFEGAIWPGVDGSDLYCANERANLSKYKLISPLEASAKMWGLDSGSLGDLVGLISLF